MAKKNPGPGSPQGSQATYEAAAAEHKRNHKGAPGKVVPPGPPRTTYPARPGGQPDDATTSMPAAGSPYDPANEAQRGR